MRIAPVAAIAEFRAGDNIVLVEGPYRSTPGVFLKLTEDIRWAEIEQWNGVVQAHPVVWMRHSALWVGESGVENDPRNPV